MKNYITLLQVKNMVAENSKHNREVINSRFVWYNHLGEECTIILKVEQSHTLYLSNSISWNTTKRNPRAINNKVYSNAAHSSKDLETTQMLVDTKSG